MQDLLHFLPNKHPVQRVNDDVRQRLIAAQNNSIGNAFGSAAELCATIFDGLKLSVKTPAEFRDHPATDLGNQSFTELYSTYHGILKGEGISGESAHNHARNLAQRTQLVRAFDKPDEALERVKAEVAGKVARFPRTIEDLERGRNPGDVFDPYILAATRSLLYGGNFQYAIGASVAHKALMIIEDLLGHLHENIVGDMRGNIRAPEPRGYNQEYIDPSTNPFPGSDVVQPPKEEGGRLSFHQVKSKTGSAKGGDGRRLGQQLRTLEEYYKADTYYDALIGNTLRGHRSMNGVLSASPNTVVLVGEAAFSHLTGSGTGPELLLRVYQNAFAEVAREEGYHIETMATGIVEAFQQRAEDAGEGFIELLVKDATGGPAEDQDSRIYTPPSRKKKQAR